MLPKSSINKFGFTLIELLIAISIIAVLSVIGLSAYSGVQQSARDARRKDDLRSIKVALELYYQRNKSYPMTDWVFSNAAQPWIPLLTSDYISKIPTDILNKDQDPRITGQYGYAYFGNNNVCGTDQPGQFYALVTQLENTTDNQRNDLQNYKWCDGSITPKTSWSKYSFAIISDN